MLFDMGKRRFHRFAMRGDQPPSNRRRRR
jgi:hypothetical protein